MTAVQPPVAFDRRRLDLGRITMVPIMVLLLLVNVSGLLDPEAGTTPSAVELLNAVVMVAFYATVIWAYLVRSRAGGRDASVPARLAAIGATFLPFVLPFTMGPGASPVRSLVSGILVLVGCAWSVWSLRALGRSFSIFPEARAVVDAGPYRWVRHPLYLGEGVAALGIVVAGPSLAAAAVWCVLMATQIFRMRREETLLREALPGYTTYMARTPSRLVPWIY